MNPASLPCLAPPAPPAHTAGLGVTVVATRLKLKPRAAESDSLRLGTDPTREAIPISASDFVDEHAGQRVVSEQREAKPNTKISTTILDGFEQQYKLE